MQEVSEAAKIITSSADENAKVIFGTVIDESLGEELRITVIATGFEEIERRTRVSEEEVQSMFKAKPTLTAPTFVKKKPSEMYREQAPREIVREPVREVEVEVEVELEEPRSSVFSTKSLPKENTFRAPAQVSPPVQAPLPPKNTTDDGEDLEIPAFIRRKMGM
jgi:cell division protein FtsZ